MTTLATGDADVLIVGGGIAGWSAAYFAAGAGRRVTIVDDGAHRASDLPLALVNPLRGHDGRLVVDGVDGMTATFALIDALRADGHAIDGARGLYRPLVDVPPAAHERSFWDRRLDGRLSYAWHDVAPTSLGLVDKVPALYLHDAGWVAPAGLLWALRAASGATVVSGRVVSLRSTERWTAVLADGTRIAARAVLWCAGARGAALIDAAAAPDASAHAPLPAYKPGSLLGVDRSLTSVPLSFGLYAAPWIDDAGRPGTLVGPTREGAHATFPDGGLAPEAARHSGDRIARTFGVTMTPREVWRGVRLARLSPPAAAALAHVPTLTALGSRGFLVAALGASRWARSL